MKMKTLCMSSALLLCVACQPINGTDDGGLDGGNTPDAQTGGSGGSAPDASTGGSGGTAPDEGMGGMIVADMAVEDMAAPTSGWTIGQHPCVGNRTDALWCDDTQTCLVGCGTTVTGKGLFATTDGGENWGSPVTNPMGYFEDARINTISRSADGKLYIGGDLPNSAAVVSMDNAGGLAEVFTRGNQVDYSFTAGGFRRASNGWALAESLTGVDLVHREADSDEPLDSWTTGRGFWNNGDADDVPNGVQILDMEVYNDQFYAVGSTIAQPPMVFTPKWIEGNFDFNIVQLASGGLGAFTGEMWGIDVNADGVSVGGVNQDRNVGMIYSISHAEDQTDSNKWVSFDVSSVFAGKATWVTDVCRTDGVIYATGRESREGWGFVLKSIDGGLSFSDITPYDIDGKSPFKDASRCQAFAEGVQIAGADGLFARNF